MSEIVGDDVSTARAAFSRHDWRTAFELLWAAEQCEPLRPADLEVLAESARWSREYGVLLDVLEQVEVRYERALAPSVRIGVHATEAIDLGDDYLGKGVHEAARIGAAAVGGEILATQSVIAAAADRYPTGEPQLLELKGLSTPLAATSVDWR